MLKSGNRSRFRDFSGPIFDGLRLRLEACGLGLDVSGLGLKKHSDQIVIVAVKASIF